MHEPDPRDDTSRDYERFETEQLARDRDAASVRTEDLEDYSAFNPVKGTLKEDSSGAISGIYHRDVTIRLTGLSRTIQTMIQGEFR
jgi:hypothetical protein